MASPNNKKLSILYILQVLRDFSDESHLLSQQNIIDKVSNLYGMQLERKSVSANIDALIDFGFDIVKSSKGCYLAERELEQSEISFLIDALFSSKSITAKQSKDIANKLSKFLSKYNRKKYNYIYKADQITRSNNKQLFYTIDILNEAIEKKKKVSFNYKRTFLDKDKIEKQENKIYTVNPYFLINNQGKYYLVCNYDYFDSITNYRVERISNIKILDEEVKPVSKLKGIENEFDIAKYANENIYMFNAEAVEATIKINDEYAISYILDWFGENTYIYKKNNEIFADIKANKQALIYWCLQYGENIELTTPISVRKEIYKIANKISSIYKFDDK